MLCSKQKQNQKNLNNKTQKHTPQMTLIGRLGGHAPSGENHWVEGAEGGAGQAGEARAEGPESG